MNNSHKRWVMAGLIAIAAFAIVLWSWNTLAVLFGLPDAQAKHVVAALVLLGTVRFAISPRAHWCGSGRERREHTPG